MKPTNPISIGDIFGHWTVRKPWVRPRHWICQCACGTLREIYKSTLTLKKTTSCGCKKGALIAAARTIHGDTSRKRPQSKEYQARKGILTRCYNPKSKSYADYGARGITVCQRWRDSFEAFLQDVGRAPGPKYTIERIRNSGNYEPWNVCWATRTAQARNTRRNRILTIGDKSMPMAAWAELYKIDPLRVKARLDQGWTPERALTTKTKRRK